MNIPSIPLTALLRAHDQYAASGSLPKVLGDGYLYSKSPIFERVRDAALSRGYRFVESESDLWHDYQAMPLLSLATILSDKNIPYFDNVTVLRKLHKQKPEIELPARLLYEVLRRNYVFHESCHCVAYSIVERETSILDQFHSKKERFVVSAFLQEAFANSMERLATAIAASKTYAFFMNMNNYMRHEPEKQEFWQQALSTFSFTRLFALAFLAFFALNIQARGGASAKQQILAIAGFGSCSPDESLLLDRLLDHEIRLSEVFREETTRGFFRLYDCEPELCSIRESNLLDDDGIATHLLALVDKLSLVIGAREASAA